METQPAPDEPKPHPTPEDMPDDPAYGDDQDKRPSPFERTPDDVPPVEEKHTERE